MASNESLVGVGNEGEGQGLGGGKLLMALGRIGAYAQDIVAQGLQFAEMIAQRAGFGRTTGGGILGIKIKYDLTAGEIAHAPFASLLIDSENFGYFCLRLCIVIIYIFVMLR